MAVTRTGSVPVGILCNCGWMENLEDLGRFVRESRFDCVEIPAWPAAKVKELADSGTSVGVVHLPQPWGDLAAPDAARRRDAADRSAAYVESVFDSGVRVFLSCLFAGEEDGDRRTSMGHAVDGYGQLCERLAALPDGGARVVLEGWPGPGPHFPVLACTPEGYRAIFEGTGAPNLGVNFDPSHLIRMGIDPIRFLEEFVSRVFHVHGKDAEILGEGVYEYGTLQPPIEAPGLNFGDTYWRYTIPGHGCARWGRIFRILAEAGYGGKLTIELEDMNFNGTEAGEKRGFVVAREFLESV